MTKNVFSMLTIAALLVLPLQAQAQQSTKHHHAAPSHGYWLSDSLNQLAVFLPSHHGATSARQ